MKRKQRPPALLLLCFLWSLGSLRSDLLPARFAAGSSPLERQALTWRHLLSLLALQAVVACTVAAWDGNLGLRSILGLGLFVVPALLVESARAKFPISTRVALFSLVPVFAVVV